jgi:hypothetical protein
MKSTFLKTHPNFIPLEIEGVRVIFFVATSNGDECIPGNTVQGSSFPYGFQGRNPQHVTFREDVLYLLKS